MPLPNVPTSPGTAPPNAGTPASLMGGDQPQQGQLPAQPGTSPVDDQTKGATDLIGNIVMSIEGLARQFPEIGEDARNIKMALVNMVQTIVGSARGPEGPVSPAMLG